MKRSKFNKLISNRRYTRHTSNSASMVMTLYQICHNLPSIIAALGGPADPLCWLITLLPTPALDLDIGDELDALTWDTIIGFENSPPELSPDVGATLCFLAGGIPGAELPPGFLLSSSCSWRNADFGAPGFEPRAIKSPAALWPEAVHKTKTLLAQDSTLMVKT